MPIEIFYKKLTWKIIYVFNLKIIILLIKFYLNGKINLIIYHY